MSQKTRTSIGPILFAVALVAVLVFFWWLLIYDHGAPSLH